MVSADVLRLRGQLNRFAVGIGGFGVVGGGLLLVGRLQFQCSIAEGEIGVGKVGPQDLAGRIGSDHALEQIDSLAVILHLAGRISSRIASFFERVGLAKLGVEVAAAGVLLGDLGILVFRLIDLLLLLRGQASASRGLLGDLGEIEIDLVGVLIKRNHHILHVYQRLLVFVGDGDIVVSGIEADAVVLTLGVGLGSCPFFHALREFDQNDIIAGRRLACRLIGDAPSEVFGGSKTSQEQSA